MANPVVLHGTESHIVHSAIMDFDFEISIQLPMTVGPEPLPVVYSTDANYSFGAVANTSAMLMFGSEIPPILTVGIGYPVGGRLRLRLSAASVRFISDIGRTATRRICFFSALRR